MTTQTVSRYADLTRLPGVTGDSIQRQIATLKARITARYVLTSVPGRPDELEWRVPATSADRYPETYPTRTISIGYGCGTIRIRKHGIGRQAREWIDTIDIQPNDGWHGRVYEFLDGFFDWQPGQERAKSSLIFTRDH